MGLVQRLINSTFVIGEGTFGDTGSNQVDLSGLRTTCDITYAGGLAAGTLQLAIYGMTLSMMNQLSTLGMLYTTLRRNSITVTAGDAAAGMATVFQGDIKDAWPDMKGAPDVAFRVAAVTGLIASLAPAPAPISINGSADAATLLSGIATQQKWKFQNNGVTAKISHAYYAGSPIDQAKAIVRDAGIEWNYGENGTLKIWNPGAKNSDSVVLISKDTGLKQYPTYTSNGIMFETLWNPSIGLGTPVQIKSDLVLKVGSPGTPAANPTPADGTWIVYSINHRLDSKMPKGRWFSEIQAAPPNTGPFTPTP